MPTCYVEEEAEDMAHPVGLLYSTSSTRGASMNEEGGRREDVVESKREMVRASSPAGKME